ncbi:MAG: DUF2029 domain-containing protein [Flavobacterium sp.]|nr:DUF2029 domain-containing protein [Flavobacterium sp.]
MKEILSKYYGFFPLILLLVFYGFKAIYFPIHDFANYYFGGKFLAEQHFSSSIYFPFEFNRAINTTGQTGIFASYAPNTPFLALLFAPFSLLPIAIAKLIFNGISILLFVYSLKKLADFYKIDSFYLLLIPILFFIPIKNEILFGQVYFLIFFLSSESWLAYQKNQLKLGAFYLAIAILLKVFPALLILLPLFKRQFKFILFVGGFGLILLSVSVLFSGIEIWQFMLTDVLSKASQGEISEAYVPNYQSFFMFFKELLVYEPTLNNTAIFNSPEIFSSVLVTIKITLLTFGYFVTRKTEDYFMIFSYWILVMILISPYGSTYTLILLLFPCFALLQSNIAKPKKIAGLLLIFLANNLPTTAFLKYPFPLSYLRLFLLLLFLILLLLHFHKHINYKIAGFIALISAVFTFNFAQVKTSNSKYFLEKGSPILIYDFQLKNQQLIYSFWNENGENIRSIPFKYSNSKPVELKGKEIIYNGNSVISDGSNKRNPVLIDGKMILYLSDFDRGIGFYTLRKIMLNPTDNE